MLVVLEVQSLGYQRYLLPPTIEELMNGLWKLWSQPIRAGHTRYPFISQNHNVEVDKYPYIPSAWTFLQVELQTHA